MNNAVWKKTLSCLIVILFLVSVSSWAQRTRVDKPYGSLFGEISYDGHKRAYLIHLPPSYLETRPTPLVIALHGSRGSGRKMEELSGLSRQSDKSDFIVVYPDAIERNWNDGRNVQKYFSHREKIDDVGFVSALIDALGREFNVDHRRIYVTGVSNGALMTHRLACEMADKIAAIAPVIGAMPENMVKQCSPAKPIPLLMINGTKDPFVPWNGGYIQVRGEKRGKILSVPDTVSFWISHNSCSSKPRIVMEPDLDSNDGTRVRKIAYEGCNEGAAILLYEIQGGGHTWPRGQKYLPEFLIGKTSQDIDGAEIIWEFFRKYTR